MPKLTTYACDKCNEITEVADLCPVYVYCFNPIAEDPKIVEFDYVCLNCREQFADIVKGWSNAEPLPDLG
jgi:hypothetical protein